ncbi:MAG: phosphatase PAP2 family protein [Minisyncoccales bacterium]
MDKLVFEVIHGIVFRSELVDMIVLFFAKYFPYVLIVSSLFIIRDRSKKSYRMLTLAFISAFLARFLFTDTIRRFFFRERPFLSGLTPLFDHSPTASFPSGHTAFFFALSTIIFIHNKRAGIIFFASSFLVGIARVASGIHWPSDIMGGIAIGVLSALLVFYTKEKFKFLYESHSSRIGD